MPRKKAYVPKSFESAKGKADIFAGIYASMIQSLAWKKLTKPQMVLYLYLKLQYYGQKPIPDLPDTCFYFNQQLWRDTYALYSNKNAFYRDRDRLVELGFIDRVVRDSDFDVDRIGSTHPKAVYKFSDRWREST